MDCVNCWGRYSHPERFRAPASIWQEPSKLGSSVRSGDDTLGNLLKISLSLVTLDVLANLHNKLMHGKGAKPIKLVAVIGLSVAAIAVGAFAILEGLVRLVVGVVLILPLFMAGYKGKKPYLPAMTGVASILQTLTAARTIYQFATSNENVVPETPFIE